MKKVSALIMGAVTALNLAVCPVVFADGGGAKPYGIGIGIGDYIQFGKYNDEPILWRYAADDENGMLILSDKILCEKPLVGTAHIENTGSEKWPNYTYITNYWSDSFIREWLNSDAAQDEVDWQEYYSKYSKYKFSKTDHCEAGFLCRENFTSREKHAIKSVAQWTMLPMYFERFSQNGIYESYNPVTRTKYVGHGTFSPVFCDFSEVDKYYSGAAYKEEDKIFLPDEMQLLEAQKSIGSIRAFETEKLSGDKSGKLYYNSYYLRTPFATGSVMCIDQYGDYEISYKVKGDIGVRPAFYADERNAVIISGGGTEDDPYIMTGKLAENEEDYQVTNTEDNSHISVICDNKQVELEYKIHIENDRIFVELDDFDKILGTTTARDYLSDYIITDGKDSFGIEIKETDVVKLKPNSKYIHDGERIKLDVAPRYLALNVYVPLRAFSELFGAKVEWVEDEQKVVITTR